MNMSVKRGDVVLYLLQGRTLNAIVLATRSSEVAHLGSKDEPLVSLAFSDPARETGLAKDPDTGEYVYPFGRVPQIFIEHDVVHASHEFSDEFKAKKGLATDAQIAAARGLGEYREVIIAEASPIETETAEPAADPDAIDHDFDR
jgi:hypothetical protein